MKSAQASVNAHARVFVARRMLRSKMSSTPSNLTLLLTKSIAEDDLGILIMMFCANSHAVFADDDLSSDTGNYHGKPYLE